MESNRSPVMDVGIGLVMRLNVLLTKADYQALNGDFDEWNYTLDRIYCNVMYRNPMKVNIGEKSVDIEITDDEAKIYKEFQRRIRIVKLEKLKAMKAHDRNTFEEKKQEHYDLLMLKDIWLKKTLNRMNIYMKEVEFDPTSALFGG